MIFHLKSALAAKQVKTMPWVGVRWAQKIENAVQTVNAADGNKRTVKTVHIKVRNQARVVLKLVKTARAVHKSTAKTE